MADHGCIIWGCLKNVSHRERPPLGQLKGSDWWKEGNCLILPTDTTCPRTRVSGIWSGPYQNKNVSFRATVIYLPRSRSTLQWIRR